MYDGGYLDTQESARSLLLKFSYIYIMYIYMNIYIWEHDKYTRHSIYSWPNPEQRLMIPQFWFDHINDDSKMKY